MKIMSENDIMNIYNIHCNKSSDYINRYEKLPLERNNKNWKWEGKDFPRVKCLLDLQDWLSKHNLGHFSKVLSTSPGDPELELITYDKLVIAEYENGVNDLHTLNLSEKDFDLILFAQTLEHLYNPFLAIQQLYEHTKTGGYIFTSVPMINIPHYVPFYYWGVNMMGLSVLFKSAGFKIVEVGGWGNKKYIDFLFKNLTWPDYQQLIDENGMIHNDLNSICQSWILVQK